MNNKVTSTLKTITTEQISKYHPDKYADQISDAIVTACLKGDKDSHVACETLVKDNTVVIAGEITTKAEVDYEGVVRGVADSLGYKVDNIINLIAEQSPEINKAVVKDGTKKSLGAGDQGIVFGYAINCPEHDYLPLGVWVTNQIIERIEKDVAENPKTILKGDAKCQVVDTNGRITEVLISACRKEGKKGVNDEVYVSNYIENLVSDIEEIKGAKFVINPSGKWTIGGPTGDCGLTGRKLVCDAYGGYAPIGGGCTSGKDLSKVDRSGAYISRKIAVETLIDNDFEDCLVQLSFGIGLSEPRSISVVGTKRGLFGRKKKVDVSKEVAEKYDLSPSGIIENLNLEGVDLREIASGNYAKRFC